MKPQLLDVAGLRKSFRRGGAEITAVDGVSFSISRAETLALVGPSGSGKSTVARLVMRLVESDAGVIRLDGVDLAALRGARLRALRPRFQMVFQEPLAAFNPRATVGRVLDDPLRIHGLAARTDRPAAVAALLERVGLQPEVAARAVHEISGGQRQRVAIARAIATNPALIVLDEAVSALDVGVREKILKLLIELQTREKIAYLFITHDLAVARAIGHRIAVMDSGRIVETGFAAELVGAPQSSTAKALVAATPKLPSDDAA